MLIPTLYKVRLSREFSYPVGAELLSEHLAGVPRFSDLRLCFSDVVTVWKSKFQRMLKEGSDYAIIEARLWEPFELFVYPVQRHLKHAAQDLLISQGLPMLRDWMLLQNPDNTLRDALCRIMFMPPTQAVYLRERLAGNERDVHGA